MTEYIKTIENQLRNKNPISTYETYQKLLEAGIEKIEAKELLAGVLELTIRVMFVEESEFDEEQWTYNLNRISEYILKEIGCEQMSEYNLERNMARVRKEYGYIAIDEEDELIDELEVIESTLYSFGVIYGVSSEDIKRIVMIVCNRLNGYVHDKKLNFFTGKDKKIYLLCDILEEKCNPYMSEYVYEIVKEQIDIDNPANCRVILTPMIQCLERIYKSILFWEKQLGSNGYLEFLEKMSEALGCGNPYSAYNQETLVERALQKNNMA